MVDRETIKLTADKHRLETVKKKLDIEIANYKMKISDLDIKEKNALKRKHNG